MMWFTWRQFRTQTWVTLGGLAVVAVALFLTGRNIAQLYADSGIATCTRTCDRWIDLFLDQAKSGMNGVVYNLGTGLLYVVPALIGVFWGAPLIARELENGTHRLVWNQSITRTRWLVTKLAVLGTASVITASLLSIAMSWWATDLDRAAQHRITPVVFAARGIVPIGYAVFAFALGVTLGMLLRRTVPAMAATLAGYTAVAVAMPVWLRAYLAPIRHTTVPLQTETISGLSMTDNGRMRVFGGDGLSGGWMLSNRTITPSGNEFVGPADPQFCGRDSAPKACFDWIGSLGLREDIAYHPGNQFWTLQFVETGVLVGVALLLTAFCIWWTRKRLT